MSDTTATTTTTEIEYEPLDLDFSIDKITDNVRVNSNNVVVGDGAFDKLMATAAIHLSNLYNQNQIRGEDYAAAYTELYKNTLQIVMDTWVKKLGVDIQAKLTEIQYESEDAKKALYEAQRQLTLQQATTEAEHRPYKTLLIQAQAAKENAGRDLYVRQTTGFDDTYKKDVLKLCLDTWGVAFSVAKDAADISIVPNPSKAAQINTLFTDIMNDMDSTYVPPVDSSDSSSSGSSS